MSNKRFIPVRGTEAKLDLMGFNDGYVYFAVDTGKIFIDYTQADGTMVSRKLLGSGSGGGSGSNSGIYYANYTPTDAEKLEDEINIPIGAIEGGEYPEEDDLIINLGDNCFYRVIKVQRAFQNVLCRRLTVAGGGGGDDPSSLASDIELTVDPLPTVNLINGHSQEITFVATSAKNKKGNSYDSILTINWKLEYTDDGTNYNQYNSGTFQVPDGEKYAFEFGKLAKDDASSRLVLVASQTNHPSTVTRLVTFRTSKLELQESSSFSNLSYFEPNKLVLQCNVNGAMDKIVEYYFDNEDEPFLSVPLAANSATLQTVNVSQYIPVVNGYHKVWIRLFQSINGEKGIEVEPLIFEVAVYDGLDPQAPPIIWLGDYKDEYYSYDTIQIPFRVFDPQAENPIVHFKRNNIELSYSPQTVTDSKKFAIFEIANPELNIINHYTITCGDGARETTRKIEIRVVNDPTRTDFGIQKQGFLTYLLNTVGSGRSNSETLAKRTTLTNASTAAGAEPCAATFTNFNWYNNGWTTDEDNKTCLRISNGAKLSIPIGRTVFSNPSGSQATEQSHSIELTFKVRNVQDYSNLIRTITRYKNDEDLYKAFYDEETGKFNTTYTNYDAFLAWYLKTYEVEFVDKNGIKRRMEYDDLEFSHIAKQINLNNAIGSYYSGNTKAVTGLCLGPQDAFFSNGIDTVNVSYVENKIITLSVVCKYSKEKIQNLIYIYLNGVLTSVVRNTQENGFTVENDKIEFNSDYCDIDLYKIRVYRTDLNVNDIVMNYAADFENVNIYDQNKLAEENTAIDEFQFSYTNMIKYNNDHPDTPLMPYIIFDTTKLEDSENKLPYSKKVKLNVGVEFVNTPLEMYYNKGKLEELAKADKLFGDGATAAEKQKAVETYYKYHCPSFISDSASMSVQGTSSEFYPRRNYKIKTKNADAVDGEKRVNIFLNRGPFREQYNADVLGSTQKPYILSTTLGPLVDSATGQLKIKYYEDENGEREAVFDEANPYRPNTFYIENTAYVKRGSEKTRQEYWYFNNYTCGTTKFTMKIDYMESSGTYNMGFANMVKNAYSKHPLDDYNNAKAFQVLDPDKTVETEATEYVPGTTYTYYNHKGNPKTAGNEPLEDNLVITSQEDFDLGPYALYQKLMTENPAIYTKLKVADSSNPKYNKWYIMAPGYSDFKVENTDDYRTSVRGFRVLAFHKKKPVDGSTEPIYQFIGIYNMLLDKGSDEVYGFALDNTTGKDPKAKFIGDGSKSVPKVAECWEFENNSRTFCSYRDPQDRKDLKFDVFNADGSRVLNAVQSAPVVADSFEYRYHDDEDILDYIMAPDGECKDDPTLTFSKDNITLNQENRAQRLLKDYSNWERAVAWVWSTCTEKVVSNGTYKICDVGEELFDSSKHYIMTTNPLTSEQVYTLAEEYVEGTTYYKKNPDYNPNQENSSEYIVAYIGTVLFSAVKTKLYTGEIDKNNNVTYIPCYSTDTFNPDKQYYTLEAYSDEELDTKADRLVVLCEDEAFDESQTYYNYDGNAKCGKAVTKANVTAETYQPNKYYIGTIITYGDRSYKYDTQEYRGDKFTYELSDHFDKEYMATYFVMTEIFECYDSRGKNCMMASWGPQKEGGDYIWYPIFYDIDTQLGINNTGIPSFEYNVDATEDGNYSTSDSVLWNNFYKYFKTGLIIPKYRHLRGITTSVFGSNLKQPPLKTVDRIESYYLTDYNTTNNLADLGTRPLVAVNLDEYYKYITITNDASYLDGTTGHISSDTTGVYTVDTNGTYFYALQGNRSLSRQQFLSNRLEYIDSWLNEGNYQRGGANRIRGRVAANNKNKTSDKWVETASDPYFKDESTLTKNHLFDAEYWMTLTPAHSSYITLGDDNEAYPSRKYDGIHALRFNIDSIENGVRKSENYPEQLLYVYGINQMKDLGDMSNLYWQEFEISGDATKLTSLKLGYDGLDENGERWHNDNVNQFSIPASASDSKGMPLLKEVNMSNIQFNAASPVLDLTSCEKLENFRATGSNLINVQFAKGVALNTVYLPTSITNLELIEANLLKNVITEDEYENPVRDEEGNLHANPGLYLQGFFDNTSTGDKGDTVIASLNIAGGGLGYDSYKLLKQYYTIRSQQTNTSQISMTNVNWCPYVQMTVDDMRDPSITYYIDNGHYGLEPYTYTDFDTWTIKVENGEIYRKDETIPEDKINQITDLAMFKEFISDKKWIKNSSKNIPDISGIIYINNTEVIKESELRNTIQVAYPNLTIFCANVEQGYTARFVIMDEDEGNDGRYQLIGSMTLKDGETWFADPINAFGDVSEKKPNHDFYGWALTNSANADILINIDKSINKWSEQTLDTNIHTYTFYAICPIHKWNVKYYYKDNTLIEEKKIPHGNYAVMSTIIPWKDDSDLPLDQTYKFLGYSRSATASSAIKIEEYMITEDTTFYAVFDNNPINVYEDIHPEYFAVSEQTSGLTPASTYYTDWAGETKWNISDGVTLALTKKVKGKITVPAFFDVNGVSKKVIAIDATFGSPGDIYDTDIDSPRNPGFPGKSSTLNSVTYVPVCYGENLTHVFFEKYTENDVEKCNIRLFCGATFSHSMNLVWVEFPEGLRLIGDYAFKMPGCQSRVVYPKFSNVNIGGTISVINQSAFQNTFSGDNDTLIIGSNVQKIDNGGFTFSSYSDLNNDRTLGIKKIIIGTPEAKSKLRIVSGDPAFINYASWSAITIESIDWYTTLKQDAANSLFSGFNKINYINS